MIKYIELAVSLQGKRSLQGSPARADREAGPGGV